MKRFPRPVRATRAACMFAPITFAALMLAAAAPAGVP